MGDPRRIRRFARALAALLVVATVASTTVAGAAGPAGAQTLLTQVSATTPVTWVDGDGRQYTVTSAVTPYGSGHPVYTTHLVVMRSLPDGTPDATWGSFPAAGSRTLALTPPADDLQREDAVALGEGVITITWKPASCAWLASSCDRWVQTLGLDGTVLTSVHLGTFDGRPFQALSDGSFLTRRADGFVGWLGPDGADRGATEVDGGRLRNGAVTADGELLLLDDVGSLTRRPPGGPVDLTLDARCLGGAVGTAPDDGIVVVCAQTETSAAGLPVWWWDQDGTEHSSTTIPVPRYQPAEVDRALVDAAGRLWIGLLADRAAPLPSDQLVLSIDSAAPEPELVVEYQRATAVPGAQDTTPDGDARAGITDLRDAGEGRVALADHQACCLTIEGRIPHDQVHALTLPRPGTTPKDCDLAPFDVALISRELLAVAVPPCDQRGITSSHADGYVLRQTTPSGTTSDRIPIEDRENGFIGTTSFTFGVLTEFSLAAYNETGETPWPASTTVRTVLPWASTAGFLRDLRATLRVTGSTAEPAPPGHVADIEDRSITPAQYIADVAQDGTGARDLEPVARLYRALFLRDPDRSGLEYWARQRAAGVRLATIAESFARSSELVRRYGSLTDAQFVTRVYRNVLGREPDPAGQAFWTKRLASRRATRGSLLAQFSESSEHRRLTDGIVGPLVLTYLMVHRLPTSSERATWSAAVQPRTTAADTLLRSQEFLASRIPHPHA
ncbi:MAG: hypothetical protein JWO77_904 [Ilumatobacteraceae bacterium]|nr:hypothetical protein [Ilumatobacteraceae bacterium]